VDGHRNLPDEPEPRWYAGDRAYPDSERERRGASEARHLPPIGEEGFGDYRVPEPRVANASLSDFDSIEGEPRGRYSDLGGRDTADTGDIPNRYGPVGRRSGEPLPPLPGERPIAPERPMLGERPIDEPMRHATEPIDRTGPRRAAGVPPGAASAGVTYRSRWPGLTALLIVVGIALELPALQVFAIGFSHTSPDNILAGVFMITGVPLFACGLYALLTGGAVVPGQPAARFWLRGTLAALPVGLILFVAAALSVGPGTG
jgi:hypothetical protein